jgi:hypothetical protein
MHPRPKRITWSLPSGRDAAAVFVLGVAACSLAGAAWVHAGGGLPSPGRAPAAPAGAAVSADCLPAISSLSSVSAPAAGGVHITINGSNFLAAGSPPAVRFGFASVAPDSVTDTRIVVSVPEQRDFSDPAVTVVCPDGRSSAPAAFQYDDATVDPGPDETASFGRGTVITLHGSNFRCSNPRAWLDDGSGVAAECAVVSAGDDSLVVELPAATLRTGIVHRDIAARNVLFEGPDLVSVTPDSWPARGGVLITITGADFDGPEPARVLLGADGRADEAVILVRTANMIVARTPDLTGDGAGPSLVDVCVQKGPRRTRTFLAQCDQDVAGARVLVPAAGRAAGGTVITLRGDNFRAGAIVHVGDASVPADVLDPTHLSFVLPERPPGPHAVTVEQGVSMSPPLELEALAPPTLVSVSPDVVPLEGGTILTIEGANFGAAEAGHSRLVEVRQGGSPPQQRQTFSSISNVLKAVAPPGTPGAADLVVMIDGEEVTLPNALTYSGAAPAPAPVLSSVSPPGLTRLGGNLLTIHGSNFDLDGSGSAKVIFGSSEVTPLFVSDTQITFEQPPVAEGKSVNPLYVEKANHGSNPLYEGKREPPVSGSSGGGGGGAGGSYAGGFPITIFGGDFAEGARVRFGAADGASTERAAIEVTPTSLVVCAPEVDEHAWDEMRVVRDDVVSAPLPLSYSGPRVTGLSTSELSVSGGFPITIFGSNFAPGARVTIGGRPAEARYFNPTEIKIDKPTPWPKKRTAAFPVEPVRVENPDGAVSDSVHARWKAPELNSSDSRAARAGGGTYLTVTGQNFGPSAFVMFSGATGSDAPAVLDRTDGELVVQLNPSSPGTFETSVVDPVFGFAMGGTMERLDPPAVTGVEPSSAPLAGGVLITVHGLNFGDPGAAVLRTVEVVGAGCPSAPEGVSGGALTFLAPPGSAGPVDLVVTIDGVPDTIPAAFTYGGTTDVSPAPGAPRTLALRAGPTPFRDALGLAFAIPAAGRWQLDLFDARGARVRRWEGDSPGAAHELRWDGRTAAGAAAPPGVYFARLTAAGAQRITRAVKLE